MSAEPVWCLFQVDPDKSSIVKQSLDSFVHENIAENLQQYLQRRAKYVCAMRMENDEFPVHSDETWLSLDITYALLFPQGSDNLLIDLYRRQALNQASMIERVVTQRISAAQMLYGGLGLQKTSRLPGHFGNMFVEPEAVEETLGEVEALCGEVSAAQFVKRVNVIGRGGMNSDDNVIALLSLLPSALRIALAKKCGLLALNFPHLGTMPLPVDEKYKDDV